MKNLTLIPILLFALSVSAQKKAPTVITGQINGFEIIHPYKHLKVFDHIDTLLVYDKYCIVVIGNSKKKYWNTAIHAKTVTFVETHVESEIKIDTLTITQ